MKVQGRGNVVAKVDRLKMGKSIRVSDKNQKGGNCRSEKPNLYRCLRRCKILKIDSKKKSSRRVEVQAHRSAIFLRIDTGIKVYVRRDPQGSGS